MFGLGLALGGQGYHGARAPSSELRGRGNVMAPWPTQPTTKAAHAAERSRSWQHAKFSSAIKNVLFARTVPDLDCMSVEVMRMIPFLEHHPMLLVLHLALDLIQRIFVNRNHPLVDFRMDH